MEGYDSSDSGVYDTVDTAFPFKYTGQPGKDVSGEGPSGARARPYVGGSSYVLQMASPVATTLLDRPVHGVPRDALEYPMGNGKRGLALIFNQENFKISTEFSPNPRRGTEIDRDALVRTFESLGFQVRSFNDLSYQEICHELRRAADEDHTERDCIAVAVLSHGGRNGMLYAYDRAYHISALMDPFTPTSCPTLAGKPKLFFIQASRALRLQELEYNRDFAASESGSPGAPPYGDILISYATFEGSNSFRNVVNGSWYVQTLCAQLQSEGRSTDLVSVLTHVSRIVAERFVSVNPVQPELNNMVQQPCFTSSLRRQLWFR